MLEEGDNDIVGGVCFTDHPNTPSLAPWAWQHWIKKLYNLETTDPWNTLFINFLAWHKKYTFCFVEFLLQHLFIDNYNVEYVILVAPPGVIEIEWLEGLATRILPHGCTDPYKVQTLYLMVRQNFVPKYTVRKAVEEDNDDLVPLIHKHSERLKEVYGEYYISEILTRHQDSGRQIIVAEHANTVVAVLCLNSTVDIETLSEQFELLPYYGLKKAHEADYIERLKSYSVVASQQFLEEDDDDEITAIDNEVLVCILRVNLTSYSYLFSFFFFFFLVFNHLLIGIALVVHRHHQHQHHPIIVAIMENLLVLRTKQSIQKMISPLLMSLPCI